MFTDKMLESFKTLGEIQTYAEAQYKTILELTKRNKKLNDEVEQLRKLSESNTKIVSAPSLVTDLGSTSDEETIAKIQIAKLKEISYDRELTYEEAKRYEIFTKALSSIQSRNKTINSNSKPIPDGELLKLLESDHA